MNLFSDLKGSCRSFPFFIIAFFGLWSCSTKDDSKVSLLYKTSYQLMPQEKEVEKFNFYVKDFDSLKMGFLSEDLALYKVIKHPEYITYIAIDSRLDKTTPLIINTDSLPDTFKVEIFETSVKKNIFALYALGAKVNGDKQKNSVNTTNRFEEQ